MIRPGAIATEYSSKLVQNHLRELEEFIMDDSDDEVFDEIAPKLNVHPNRVIAKDLPKIEVRAPAPPQPIKRKPYKITKKQTGPPIVDIEYSFNYEPNRLAAPPIMIPSDYGHEYMTEQLLDLTYQFTRLSIPKL